MNYLRHPNGRGILLGDAEANRAAFIDRTSSASGSAKLRDARLVSGSRAEGECQIYGGQYHSTRIGGKTICAGSPSVIGSLLNCNEVSGRVIVVNSRLVGSTEVCDDARIEDTTLTNCTVYGDPHINSTEEILNSRIHEGVWFRPPKHIKLPWCDLSECIVKNDEQHVLLDCRCRSVSYWMKHGPKLARRWGWSQDQIDVTLATIGRECGYPSVECRRGWW